MGEKGGKKRESPRNGEENNKEEVKFYNCGK